MTAVAFLTGGVLLLYAFAGFMWEYGLQLLIGFGLVVALLWRKVAWLMKD